jgi:DNA adenine methylase
MDKIYRPVFRAPGGKFRIRKWIVGHFPSHGFYVETHCFAASVFFQKRRSKSEILNDINDQITNAFEVLRDEKTAAELQRQLDLTPLSYTEYRRTYTLPPVDDKMEMTRRLIFQSFATIGTDGITRAFSGFRGLKNHESGISAGGEWARYPAAIPSFTKRLKGVIIENRDALKVIDVYDSPKTLFYLDPPYPIKARKAGKKLYKFEMTEADHIALAERLHRIEGMAIISSYDTPFYRSLFPKWRMDRIATRAQSNGKRGTNSKISKRIECIWMSPNIHTQYSLGESYE